MANAEPRGSMASTKTILINRRIDISLSLITVEILSYLIVLVLMKVQTEGIESEDQVDLSSW